MWWTIVFKRLTESSLGMSVIACVSTYHAAYVEALQKSRIANQVAQPIVFQHTIRSHTLLARPACAQPVVAERAAIFDFESLRIERLR